MNSRTSTFVLLFAAAFSCSFAQAKDTPDSLRIDCQTLQRPSQQTVAQALHIQNFTKAYEAREQVMQIARRECLSGVNSVEIVSAPRDSRQAAPRLVANRMPVR